MKQSKFTDSQIIGALRRVEGGVLVPEIWREYGIGTATFYKWRTMCSCVWLSLHLKRLKPLMLDLRTPLVNARFFSESGEQNCILTWQVLNVLSLGLDTT